MKIVNCILLSMTFALVLGSGRIYRGYPIEIEQAPYMARVNFLIGNFGGSCGGSIVHEQFILTAGHCEFIRILNHFK